MTDQSDNAIRELLDVMAALRTPVTGCPWDLEQTFETIAPYTIEEAYEVADAIQRGDRHDLMDELGDLLLQVVYHARLAEEEESFDFEAVTRGISKKMIRRHPHVFGDDHVADAAAMTVRWDEIKAAEKAEKLERKGQTAREENPSVLDGVALALPALTRALKLQKKAARVGFDWNDPLAVLAKVKEEIAEAEAAMDEGNPDHIRGEIGDLLFTVTNLARHLDVDPEEALKETNAKFTRRFEFVEAALGSEGRSIDDASLDEMDALWTKAKAD